MSEDQTITLPRGEFAAYQRAIELGKDECARLARELTAAQERALEAEKREHTAMKCLDELHLLRELAEDLARWREAGGDIRDLTYVFEMMDRYAAMEE